VAEVDETGFLRLIRGETQGPLSTMARAGLALASLPYRTVVSLRNLAFNHGWKKVHRAGVPIVAIGNLTLGGTGKTPMVEYVARWYRQRGVRVVILSRGYGHPEGINDEGRALEENLPDVPHLQDPDRVRLAQIAVEELAAELLVLDDGFQHRRLGRDLDIVLLDALEPFGLSRLFPRGLLREPIGSLRRAGVVVLSRADLVPPTARKDIRTEAERIGGPLRWAEARHAPRDLVQCDGRTFPIADLEGKSVAAFCGIGNPEGFRLTAASLGATVAGFRVFPDHHLYGATDVAGLTQWVRDLRVDLALTTQKDLVKIRATSLGPVPLRALRIGLEIVEGADRLEKALASLLPARPPAQSPASPG
jgi:tetraacyldisaccharide 4'-kinase